MNNKCVAIFWVNDDISIPQLFVNSIRNIMSNNIDIVILTDKKTPEIKYVNNMFRYDLSEYIMVARLQSYVNFKHTYKKVLFADADSLLISPIVFPKTEKNIYLMLRKYDALINHNHPYYYPEFENKKMSEMMPFLFGAIVTIGDQSNYFKIVLDICEKLPLRFKKWYGDQVSLYQAVKDKKFNYGLLDQDIFFKVHKNKLTYLDIENEIKNRTCIVTFKGIKAKEFLPSSYKKILKYYSYLRSQQEPNVNQTS